MDADYGAQKFDRPKSEPALFLEIMERHRIGLSSSHSWEEVRKLTGGARPIRMGKRARERNSGVGLKWEVFASPDALIGGDATAWQRLFEDDFQPKWIAFDPQLHLAVSVRSYACLATTQWVNARSEKRGQ